MERDVIQELLKLPPVIEFNGINFYPDLVFNSEDEILLGYTNIYVEAFTWFNPFFGYNCGFLYLVEGISNAAEMLEAIDETVKFLKDNDLIKPE